MRINNSIDVLKIDNGERTLVHIHGFGGCKEENQPLMDFCKENNISFIGIDFPGQGNVPITTNNKPTMNYYADLAVEYIESLNLDKVIISGHSMGGAIASLIANKLTKVHVTQLILEDPVNFSLLNGDARLKLLNGCEASTSHLVYKDKKVVNEELTSEQKVWFAQLAKDFTSISLLQQLKKITYELEIPMDVIFGKNDCVISYVDSIVAFRKVAKKNKIRIHSIPNAIHKPHFENTIEYLKAISSIIG